MWRPCLIVLAAALLLVLAARGHAEEPAWREVTAAYKKHFVPLPVARMFSKDLEQELRLSRRDPFTGKARNELAKARDALKLERAQFREARRARSAVVHTLAGSRHPAAPRTLMAAYERVTADVERAAANRDRLAEAAGRRMNPGTDPGGHNWSVWVGKESSAARAVLADERKLLDAILAACGKRTDPEIRDWLRKNAATHKKRSVRMQMIHTLAQGKDPGAVLVLRALLSGEREVWARTLIVNELRAAQHPGTEEALRSALRDVAWPVRAAALDALWALDYRDRVMVGALIDQLEKETGRLRLDVRNVLVRATGIEAGIGPAEWRAWWGVDGDAWDPLPKPAPVPPADGAGVSRCFGVPTASKRIAFLLNRSAGMRSPVKRRAKDNAGGPSPEPRIDTMLNVAVWELGEAIRTLPPDAEFTVILFGSEPVLWSRRLKRASKSACARAVRFAGKAAAEGTANAALALEAALRLAQPKGLDDPAFGGPEGIDTIFLIGGRDPAKATLSRRLRQVRIHAIDVGRLGSD